MSKRHRASNNNDTNSKNGNNNRSRKIIVGIDFGTTFSGVAWAETQRPDRQFAITTWPVSKTSREGESSDKVPTKIRYTEDGIEWGTEIAVNAPDDEILEWFKLDLDPAATENLPSDMWNMGKGKGKAPARTADVVVKDYISSLGSHLRYILKRKLGDAIMKATPIEFVLTVPAMWSDVAKQKTIRACQNAVGLTLNQPVPITLVSEPEAAAIYSLHGLDPHGLKVGDTFVVCDAGGGTVDVISYTITALKPIVSIKEAAAGDGGFCGSSYLNRRFEKFLKAKLGHLEGFDDELMVEAMERFEKTIKRRFTVTTAPNEIFAVPVGGLANNRKLGITRGRYALTVRELVAIFEPVVSEAIKLVKSQIAATKVPVRAVLMVGGFGASTYFRERLTAAVDKGIQIMQPPNAWLAVVEGAVMKGLANDLPTSAPIQVTGRVARKHYGAEFSYVYDSDKHSHLKNERYWSRATGNWAVNKMNWFINQGYPVQENTPSTVDFVLSGLVSDGHPMSTSIEILQCTRSPAPELRDSSVSVLCEAEADFSAIPMSQMATRVGSDGLERFLIPFSIEMVFHSAHTAYTLIHKGTRYDTVKAEYV